MTNWTTRRRWSLAIHIGIVLIPFCFATASAAAFWYSLFRDWWIAVPMVVVIDVLALLGLVLHIAKIDSPFQVLRHVLPFVSVVPLGLELYGLLAAHNAVWVAVVIALAVTVVMTLIAWRCYVTIESLFVPPAVAAREAMHEQVRQITAGLIMAADMQAAIRMGVQDWSERADIRVAAPGVSAAPQIAALTEGVTPPTPPRGTGYVYLMRADDMCKIGCATDPLRRLRDIQGATPQHVTLVHTIETDNMIRLEAALHSAFEHRRIRGEWFQLTLGDVQAFSAVEMPVSADVIDTIVDAVQQQAFAIAPPELPDGMAVLPRRQARVLAQQRGVSERTIYRQWKAGKLTTDDVGSADITEEA